MNLSKLSLVQLGSIAFFLIAVMFLVASFSGQVNVTVNPTPANADGGAKGVHISGTFYADGGQTLGAVSSPDRFNGDGCESVNGNKNCFASTRFAAASSTLASFKSPTASSTVEVACVVTSNPLASVVQIGWGANNFSTTTLLAQNVGAATVLYGVVATTTNRTAAILGGTDGIIPPDTFVNARLGTSSIATLNAASMPAGSCSAQFRVI